MGVMRRWSANQLVAYNLRRARELREMTQQAAGAKLAEYLGKPWSAAGWSAAEQSIEGKRIRQFTPNEILAFAHLFDVPPSYFFMPPPGREDVAQITFTDPRPGSRPRKVLDAGDVLELVLLVSDPLGRRLAEMDMDPQNTLRKQLRDQTAAMVAEAAPLDAQIEHLSKVTAFLSSLKDDVLQWAMSRYSREIDALTDVRADTPDSTAKPKRKRKGGKKS